VLLGLKKRGFGAGKYVGVGGKVEPGETVEAAAIREVEEEIGVKVLAEDLLYRGTVTFLFPAKSEWDLDVAIFTAERWSGEPDESDEIKPEWFTPDTLPYNMMWPDAPYWLPQILDGLEVRATISYQADNATVKAVWLSATRTAVR